jgi:hypothetical protein
MRNFSLRLALWLALVLLGTSCSCEFFDERVAVDADHPG